MDKIENLFAKINLEFNTAHPGDRDELKAYLAKFACGGAEIMTRALLAWKGGCPGCVIDNANEMLRDILIDWGHIDEDGEIPQHHVH